MKKKLKIGDSVIVMDPGRHYSTHYQMAEEMNLKSWKSEKELDPILNNKGIVIDIVNSGGDIHVGLLFPLDSSNHIINSEGLVRMNKPIIKDDEKISMPLDFFTDVIENLEKRSSGYRYDSNKYSKMKEFILKSFDLSGRGYAKDFRILFCFLSYEGGFFYPSFSLLLNTFPDLLKEVGETEVKKPETPEKSESSKKEKEIFLSEIKFEGTDSFYRLVEASSRGEAIIKIRDKYKEKTKLSINLTEIIK